MKILDCTLRDGGYYNDWDFSTPLVESYLEAMDDAGIDFVEIGFRFAKSDAFLGAYAYSTDSWLKSLKIPEGLSIGVMCNAKDLVAHGDSGDAVRKFFSPASESPVELVRIAAHFREVEGCKEAVQTLHELGYRVGFNLMQASGRTEEEITSTAEMVSQWPLEALYFADSLGNMWPGDVVRTVNALKAGWHGDLGFHSHDNMGNGLANTMAAFEAGATWLDATVLGMGRGAGNVRLEYLLLELIRKKVRDFRVDSLLELVVNEFSPMQEEYRWGPNLFYHLSALYGVHPTYVQEMLSEERYSHKQVISALQRLGDGNASGYSPDKLQRAVKGDVASSDGSWVATDWLKGKEVLIVGPGESGRRHLPALLQYIDKKQPVVLCLNSNPWFPSDKVAAWVACNEQRLVLDRDYYSRHKGKLLTPLGAISSDAVSFLNEWELLDYGMKVEENSFSAEPTGCVIPRPLTVLYAVAIANASGASKITVSGIDGFDIHDPRHSELEESVGVYREHCENALPIVALTPTSISFNQSSVYCEG